MTIVATAHPHLPSTVKLCSQHCLQLPSHLAKQCLILLLLRSETVLVISLGGGVHAPLPLVLQSVEKLKAELDGRKAYQ